MSFQNLKKLKELTEKVTTQEQKHQPVASDHVNTIEGQDRKNKTQIPRPEHIAQGTMYIFCSF